MTEAQSHSQPDGQPAPRRLPVWAWVIAAVVALAVAVGLVLFAPPLSFAQRSGGAYLTLDAANPATFHPDGLLVTLAEGSPPVEVQVAAIPREAFLAGDAGRAWEEARTALPGNLTPLSPIYTMQVRGAGRVIAQIAIPNDAEPLERLDLYAWDAQAGQWAFVPSQIDRPGQTISFWPADSSLSVVAFHAKPGTPVAGIVISPGSQPLDRDYGLALMEGVTIDETGALAGSPAETISRPAMLLVVQLARQAAWESGSANLHENGYGPVDYGSPAWQARVAELVTLAEPYDGLALDLVPGEGYAAFMATLAGELHAQGRALNVVVRPDDLARIDWVLLGQAADRVWLAPGHDPASYLEEGSADRALAELVSLLPRERVGLLVSGLTVDIGPSGSTLLSFDQVGALFGDIQTTPGYVQPDTPSVAPGSILPLRLSGRVESMGYDPALGASYLTYQDEAGEAHYVIFGSAQSLSHRMEWARQYALGAVAIYGLAHPDAPPGLAEGLDAFLSGLPAEDAPQPRLVWQVQGPSGEVVTGAEGDLALLQYVWEGSQEPGRYVIRAHLRAGASESVIGQFSFEVSAPEGEP